MEVLKENSDVVSLCPQRGPHELLWDGSYASSVRNHNNNYLNTTLQ